MLSVMTTPISRMQVLFILTVVATTVCDASRVCAIAPPARRLSVEDRKLLDQVWNSPRIFPYQQAEQARQLAQTECKPLVIQFIPDSTVGAKQLITFYVGEFSVPDEDLDSVVVLVVPTEQYGPFAKNMGVVGKGGFRSVSAYALTPFKQKAVPTCKSGFR